MSESKKRKATPKEQKTIRDAVREELGSKNLSSWQKACKSFAFLNYQEDTRKEWFEKNKARVGTAREILAFIDKTAKTLRSDERLADVLMSDIRAEVINGIRDVQKTQGLETHRVNSAKIAAFKTLLGYADHPERLEEGLYKGADTLPPSKKKEPKRARRGRKKEKGTYVAPEVRLAKAVESIGAKKLRLTSSIINKYIHPYQNVEIELDFGDSLSVDKVTNFSWSSSQSKIKVGFLEADLGVDPLEKEFTMDLSVKKDKKSFNVKGKIHYDDTEGGRRAEKEFTATIKT